MNKEKIATIKDGITVNKENTDMYFGNDRIELVDFKLSKLKKNS